MSCSEFWQQAPELELETWANHPHLSECAGCASIYARQRHLSAGLHALSEDSRGTGAPARVEAQLLAAFRAAHAPAPKSPTPFWRVRPAWALAAAAALLIGIGLWFVPKQSEAPAAHHRQTGRSELAAADDSVTPDAPVLEEGFIPLPNAERLEPGDDVNVVRMALPRSSMIAVGYDVPADTASEMVEADVALGPDGLARAVRFVNASL